MGPWNIRVASLMKLSSLYPLERTRISVKTAEPSIIAERIVTCLRKLSIVAVYNEQKVREVYDCS
jgi:hypothetical protein